MTENRKIMAARIMAALSFIVCLLFVTLILPYASKEKTYASESDTDNQLLVSFTLLGDTIHGDSDDIKHTRSADNLETWIPKKRYLMDDGSAVMDLITIALSENNIGYEGQYSSLYKSYYISGIQIPGSREYLRAQDNGSFSGWMYAVNDEDADKGVSEYKLADDDQVILYYSDDFNYENQMHEQKKNNRMKAQVVVDAINDLPDAMQITLENRQEVDNARAEYEALTEQQKALVPEETLEKLKGAEEAVRKLEQKGEQEIGRKDPVVCVPGKALIRKVRAGKKKLTVKWKKVSRASGYEVQIRILKQKGVRKTGRWKKYRVSARKLTKTVKKLKAGRKYQVRVRALCKVSGRIFFGKWSKTRKIRIK